MNKMRSRHASRKLRKAIYQAEKMGISETPTVALGVAMVYDKKADKFKEWYVDKKVDE